MFEDEFDSPFFWLSIAMGGLIAVFAIAGQLFGSQAISALSAAFSVALSALLVLLYRQQKSVLERQERIMEADYVPMLSYDECQIIEQGVQETFGDQDNHSIEAPRFEAYNYGKGRALNIRAEIVVATGLPVGAPTEKRNKKVREIAREAEISEAVRRHDSRVDGPIDSLDAGDSDSFTGYAHFLHLSSGEFYDSFQTFKHPDISPGDPVTWILVVEYQDALGNTYRDIPYGRIVEYVTDTPLYEFPTTGEKVDNPAQTKFKNVSYREEGIRGGVEKTQASVRLGE